MIARQDLEALPLDAKCRSIQVAKTREREELLQVGRHTRPLEEPDLRKAPALCLLNVLIFRTWQVWCVLKQRKMAEA